MKVVLSELAHTKCMYWVNKCDKEVSGFGITSIIDMDGMKQVYVHDAWLLEQEVGAAHTDIDAKALGKLMQQSLVHPKYGGNNIGTYKLNWWWH